MHNVSMRSISLINAYLFFSLLFGQPGFSLEDLNPNSATYGQMVSPSNFEGDVTILFFGHET